MLYILKRLKCHNLGYMGVFISHPVIRPAVHLGINISMFFSLLDFFLKDTGARLVNLSGHVCFLRMTFLVRLDASSTDQTPIYQI